MLRFRVDSECRCSRRSGGQPECAELTLSFIVANEGRSVARFPCLCLHSLDTPWRGSSNMTTNSMLRVVTDANDWKWRITGGSDDVVHPGEEVILFQIVDEGIKRDNLPETLEPMVIPFFLTADGCVPQTGEITITQEQLHEHFQRALPEQG